MCGLFGIINTKPRAFDYTTFCTLGVANDSRGGNSCGYFIDGHYEYGVGKENKWFQYFFQENEFLNTVKECTIALGHCRKASVGAINEKTAQPVVITNSGKVEYVLIHNGTIRNYKELAEKYIPKVDIKDLTDSQVMAQIFYHSGYDVLDEYSGGAAFVIVDYRKNTPKVLLFKGASKKNTNSKEKSEERPLYFCEGNGELVFSSIYPYLDSLRRNLISYSLKANCLCEYTNGKLDVVKEFSREDVYQDKEKFYWDYSPTYDNYASFVYANLVNNTYSSEGRKLKGKIVFSEFGLITNYKSNNSEEYYFWDGIPLQSRYCYNFLNSLVKETRLNDTEFDKRFNNLIRFLSIDGIYEENNVWYKATSPIDREPYTGILNMLTTVSTINFEGGRKLFTTYSEGQKRQESIERKKLNFKDIKQKCKSLMNLQNNGQML